MTRTNADGVDRAPRFIGACPTHEDAMGRNSGGQPWRGSEAVVVGVPHTPAVLADSGRVSVAVRHRFALLATTLLPAGEHPSQLSEHDPLLVAATVRLSRQGVNETLSGLA